MLHSKANLLALWPSGDLILTNFVLRLHKF